MVIIICAPDILQKEKFLGPFFILTSGFQNDTTTQCCNFPAFLNPVNTSGGKLESLIVKDGTYTILYFFVSGMKSEHE